MRIELNSGGLGSVASILNMQSDISNLLGKSDAFLSALRSVKNYTYNMNGGVGLLQRAVDSIEDRFGKEETRKSNLFNVQTKINRFIELVSTIDKDVSDQVNQNQEEFYKVNAWAVPAVGSSLDAFFSDKAWIVKALRWIPGNPLSVSAVGGIALSTIALLSKSGGKSDTDAVSFAAYSGGAGPSGKVDDKSASGSLLSGNAGVNARIAGVDANINAEGELVGGSAKYDMGGQWNVEKGEIGVGITGKAEGHLAKGSVSGGIGLLNEKIEGSVGNASAKGEAGLTLMKDGKVAPAAKVEASAGANVAQGSVKQSFGTDELDVHSKAEGELLTAKAKASASAGVITYTDENTGAVKTKIGAEASAGAEAYVAQGTAKGGVNLFGLKIDVGVTGKAGGAGVKVGGGVSTAGASGEVGAGLGLGVGLKVDVDWTEFKPEKILPWNWF